jgi:hypothetical protein
VKITLKSRWNEIFRQEDPEDVRRQRWEEWKRIALAAGEKEMVDHWTDTEGCHGCLHKNGDWCENTGLPCTVNPYLTMRQGMGIGMACMGLGFDDGINQGELFSFGNML